MTQGPVNARTDMGFVLKILVFKFEGLALEVTIPGRRGAVERRLHTAIKVNELRLVSSHWRHCGFVQHMFLKVFFSGDGAEVRSNGLLASTIRVLLRGVRSPFFVPLVTRN